jgi:hypothetical protein
MTDTRRDQGDNDLPRPERTPVEELRDWETVQLNETDVTHRLKILGGWLYRVTSIASGMAVVFVPDGGLEGE